MPPGVLPMVKPSDLLKTWLAAFRQGDERLQGELPEIFVHVRVDREEVRP